MPILPLTVNMGSNLMAIKILNDQTPTGAASGNPLSLSFRLTVNSSSTSAIPTDGAILDSTGSPIFDSSGNWIFPG